MPSSVPSLLGVRVATTGMPREVKFNNCEGERLVAAAWWSSLRPGLSVGVKFEEDDLWHERLLLWPCDRVVH